MADHLLPVVEDLVETRVPGLCVAVAHEGQGTLELDVGLGWFHRNSDRASDLFVEHLGGGGGFWNMMRLYPRHRLGVLAMGNATSYDHQRLAEAALKDFTAA